MFVKEEAYLSACGFSVTAITPCDIFVFQRVDPIISKSYSFCRWVIGADDDSFMRAQWKRSDGTLRW